MHFDLINSSYRPLVYISPKVYLFHRSLNKACSYSDSPMRYPGTIGSTGHSEWVLTPMTSMARANPRMKRPKKRCTVTYESRGKILNTIHININILEIWKEKAIKLEEKNLATAGFWKRTKTRNKKEKKHFCSYPKYDNNLHTGSSKINKICIKNVITPTCPLLGIVLVSPSSSTILLGLSHGGSFLINCLVSKFRSILVVWFSFSPTLSFPRF